MKKFVTQEANRYRQKISLAESLLMRICLSVAGLFLFDCSVALAQPFPRPDHIVVVIEENKSLSQIIDNPDAPYLNELSKRGTLFTQSHGVTHPSQPNYLALFSGSTQGVIGDDCPHEFHGSNLAALLFSKGLSFKSYLDRIPQVGFDGCDYGAYKRKHNPASNWRELAMTTYPFSVFPQNYSELPTVAFVVPDLRNDMHDGSISLGDAWLAKNIEPYAQWAMQHNSLLIVTWDEDNGTTNNLIPTIMIGAMVKAGSSTQLINHYNVLRTIEELFGLEYVGESANVMPLSGIWRDTVRKNK